MLSRKTTVHVMLNFIYIVVMFTYVIADVTAANRR